ncbi:MAG: flagellar motor switch protein FliN [Candidatus Acidiferrales bacterium]
MNTGALPEISVGDQKFAQIWADATARVLESLHAKQFTATPRPPAAAETAVAASGESLWMRFQASGSVAGEFAFQFTRSDGVRLAQLLAGEPLDGAAAFNETHTDALQETFRQFAGVAASACKSKYGEEAQFQLQPGNEPAWTPAGYAAWLFAAPEIAPLQWTLLLNADLHSSLDSFSDKQQANAAPEAPVAPAPTPAIAESPEPPAMPEYAPSQRMEPRAIDAPPDATAAGAEDAAPMPANLDVLLDVELDARLRFGQRDMLLREILELRPGSVVELDRKVQEPAELLVSGRVIARGEVVIVDGNYGLRITDIVQPQQRLESVET